MTIRIHAIIFAIGLLSTSIPVLAQTKAPDFRSDRARMPGELAALYDNLKPRPNEVRWKDIPWLNDIGDGIKVAKDEKRPLFIYVSTDEPLDRC
jgi:hypothetical protein